jgi:hypothetical protein
MLSVLSVLNNDGTILGELFGNIKFEEHAHVVRLVKRFDDLVTNVDFLSNFTFDIDAVVVSVGDGRLSLLLALDLDFLFGDSLRLAVFRRPEHVLEVVLILLVNISSWGNLVDVADS